MFKLVYFSKPSLIFPPQRAKQITLPCRNVPAASCKIFKEDDPLSLILEDSWVPVKDIKSHCLEVDDDYFLLFFPFICKGTGWVYFLSFNDSDT